MKRLVALSHLEDSQLEELRALLRERGIGVSETPPTLFSPGALWVQDEDLDPARSVLRQGENLNLLTLISSFQCNGIHPLLITDFEREVVWIRLNLF